MQISNITAHTVRKIKQVESVEKHLLQQIKSDFCFMKTKGETFLRKRKHKVFKGFCSIFDTFRGGGGVL